MGMVIGYFGTILLYLDSGEVNAKVAPDDIKNDPKVIAAYLGCRRRYEEVTLWHLWCEFKEVDVHYGPIQALKKVSLTIKLKVEILPWLERMVRVSRRYWV